jgi:nucleotide-binding universal stress UspA family protein
MARRPVFEDDAGNEEVSAMKILVAYDGFEHSDNAVREAAELAGDGAEITILSVVLPDARGSKSGGHVGLAPHAHEDVARAHAYLRERGIESTMEIEHGDAVHEICSAASTGGYDLLVVGSRGLGPVGRLLLGSVSAELARRAPVPVLVAGKDHTERIEPVSAR